MADVQGTWDEGFQGVVDAFAANLDGGDDVGASAAVFVEGECVVDIWGGVTDVEAQTPWQRDTLINVWSTTKTMCNLAALVLADRGELDLHAPVATYWPEFAANGKDGITTAHFLGHTSGLSGFEGEVTEELLFDWDAATARLAGQAPWWDDRSRVRLPRHHPGLPRGRGRPPHHRVVARLVLRQGDRRPARRRLPHRDRAGARRPRRPRHPAADRLRRRPRPGPDERGGQDAPARA